MENILASVKGTGGIVSVYEDRLVISRKTATGFITQGIKGDRTIYFKDIKAIEYKKPTIWANGYIQFATNAELATSQTVGLLKTKSDAMKDSNALILRAFHKETIKDGDQVYKVAMEQWNKAKNKNNVAVVQNQVDPADEILKYKKLLDMGILTKEDFEAKKKQLLGL